MRRIKMNDKKEILIASVLVYRIHYSADIGKAINKVYFYVEKT